MVALKAQWSVVAGLIPGEIDPQYTRVWTYTSVDHARDDASVIFAQCCAEAHNYAALLNDPNQLNWVRLEFMWM